MSGRPDRGGVLLEHLDEQGQPALAFVPASTALRLVTLSALTEVPGVRAPARGIALADGEVVTVLAIGAGDRGAVERAPVSYRPGGDWSLPGANHAVLCGLGALRVAIVGARVIDTGLFEAAGEQDVIWRGAVVRALDVRALYARAEAAIWAGRAAARPPGQRWGRPGNPSGMGGAG